MFRKGGAKPSDVESLVQQSHQLLWAYEDVQEGVPELVARLKEAQGWAQKASFLALAYLHAIESCSTFESCSTLDSLLCHHQPAQQVLLDRSESTVRTSIFVQDSADPSRLISFSILKMRMSRQYLILHYIGGLLGVQS